MSMIVLSRNRQDYGHEDAIRNQRSSEISGYESQVASSKSKLEPNTGTTMDLL